MALPPAPGPLAAEVFVLVVRRGEAAIDYATIAEVHHPEHLRLADLRALPGRAGVPAEGGRGEVAALLDLVSRAAKGPLGTAAEGAAPDGRGQDPPRRRTEP